MKTRDATSRTRVSCKDLRVDCVHIDGCQSVARLGMLDLRSWATGLFATKISLNETFFQFGRRGSNTVTMSPVAPVFLLCFPGLRFR